MQDIQQAVDALRAGKLVAFPTETVYGLGADALNPEAAASIFAAKGRPADHPLIVHLPDAGQLQVWASSIPKEALALARAFWPGPLTLILKRSDEVPDIVTGGQDTVGLRVPGHPLALALLRAFGSGIAAPSANRFGRISPTTAEHVREELGGRVCMILDGGPCDVGIESTILDLSRDAPVILRPGAITADDIAAVIGRQPQRPWEAVPLDVDAPRVSGSLAAHYAPRTPLQVLTIDEILAALSVPGSAEPTAVLARRPPPDGLRCKLWREAPADAAGFAHELYAALRDLDHLGAARIFVEAPEASSSWQAVADRLGRAALGSGADEDR